MKTSNKGLVFLAHSENIALSKYLDTRGVWTIGIGATVSEIPDLPSWPLNKSLTLKEVFELYSQSFKKYEAAVNNSLKVAVSQSQFDALVSIAYNIGIGWFGVGGHKTASFVERINDKASPGKLTGYKDVWSPQNGKYLKAGVFTKGSVADGIMKFLKQPEITLRRTREAVLFSSGDYGELDVNVFAVSKAGRPLYNQSSRVDPWQYLSED